MTLSWSICLHQQVQEMNAQLFAFWDVDACDGHALSRACWSFPGCHPRNVALDCLMWTDSDNDSTDASRLVQLVHQRHVRD
jgi:hypothetical protein